MHTGYEFYCTTSADVELLKQATPLALDQISVVQHHTQGVVASVVCFCSNIRMLSSNERILKIGQGLTKLMRDVFETQCRLSVSLDDTGRMFYNATHSVDTQKQRPTNKENVVELSGTRHAVRIATVSEFTKTAACHNVHTIGDTTMTNSLNDS